MNRFLTRPLRASFSRATTVGRERPPHQSNAELAGTTGTTQHSTTVHALTMCLQQLLQIYILWCAAQVRHIYDEKEEVAMARTSTELISLLVRGFRRQSHARCTSSAWTAGELYKERQPPVLNAYMVFHGTTPEHNSITTAPS